MSKQREEPERGGRDQRDNAVPADRTTGADAAAGESPDAVAGTDADEGTVSGVKGTSTGGDPDLETDHDV